MGIKIKSLHSALGVIRAALSEGYSVNVETESRYKGFETGYEYTYHIKIAEGD